MAEITGPLRGVTVGVTVGVSVTVSVGVDVGVDGSSLVGVEESVGDALEGGTAEVGVRVGVAVAEV